MSTNEDFIAAIEEYVRPAAASVARRYRSEVTYADLAQEGYVWALTHRGTVRTRLEDGKRGEYRLIAQLAGHMQKVARQEKATRAGYSPDDEVFYSKGMIELALPAVWDESYMIRPPVEGDESMSGRSNNDPAAGNDWLASVIDVRRAWAEAELSQEQRDALELRYRFRLSQQNVATMQGTAKSTANERINSGLRALIDALGGRRPGECPADCECRPEPVGTRHVISNANARAITNQGYDE
jgi:DNA-directed RNA polymerase specialized sigma24 family protein